MAAYEGGHVRVKSISLSHRLGLYAPNIRITEGEAFTLQALQDAGYRVWRSRDDGNVNLSVGRGCGAGAKRPGELGSHWIHVLKPYGDPSRTQGQCDRRADQPGA